MPDESRGRRGEAEAEKASRDAVTLHGPRVTLRPTTEADLPRLGEILTHPEIAKWWIDWDAERVRRDLLAEPDVTVLTIEIGGEVGGLIMYEEETDPDYHFAQIDVTLAAEHVERGLGSEALRVLIAYLIRDRGHHHFLIDPSVENARAIRAYEKVGFKRVGVLRQYERRGDHWGDGLLMDLIADEFEVPEGG